MRITEDAPVVTRDEILIDADPDTVWRLQTDVAGWPAWRPGVAVEGIDGPVAPGTSFTWSTEGLTVTSTIEDVDAPRRIAWGGPADGVVGRHEWLLEPFEGGTLVRTAESWEGAVVEERRDELQAALDASLSTWLRELKAYAEAPAVDGHA